MRQAIRRYTLRTEEAYVNWLKQFMHFHHQRHPKEMDTPEVEAFLNYLEVQQNVDASTQNQAFRAILFRYRHVLKKALAQPIDALQAKKPKRLPTVLTREEVKRIITRLSGPIT